jgi:YidC/Oxa1 family membrane protein insertase
MDRKAIIVVSVCVVLLVFWPLLMKRTAPPQPPASSSSNAPALTVPPASVSATSAPAPATLSASVKPVPLVAAGTSEETIEVTHNRIRYVFTSHGGGLKFAELLDYPRLVKGRKDTNHLITLNTSNSLPVMSILGGEALQGDGIFQLSRTATGIRAEKLLTNNLRLVKDFTFSSNRLMMAHVRFENTGSQPLALPAQEVVVGAATPMGPDDNASQLQLLGLSWFNGSSATVVNESYFANRTLGCFPGTPRTEYRSGPASVYWVGLENQFFTLAVMTTNPAAEVLSRHVQLPRPAEWASQPDHQSLPDPQGYHAEMIYNAVTLAPGQGIDRHLMVYTGPKEYRTLALLADRYQNQLDLVMGFNRALGWGVTAFFAKGLLWSMNTLHDLLSLGYGWVIILITFIIKALFWPLTQASTRSMKRMSALQPQIKVLQEKFKDDPAKMNKKMMELWKEHKVNPAAGCLPMFIQLPVFIGFYIMIQSAIELRGASFLWVTDLSKPDTLGYIGTIPFNLLPLLMGGTMLWQSHLTPASPSMDPMQQKMLKYMPLIFLFILYNFSAGLTLYWTVQNLLSILQMKLTNAKEEKAAGPTAARPALVPRKR